MDRIKILLVDEVHLFLEQERTMFDRDIFDLRVASGGKEALEMVKKDRPALVFMDLHMPDMDGDKCCYLIKSDPELRTIPVVMVTLGTSEEDFERCWRAGCDEIIAKPINRHYFLAVTNKILNVPLRKIPRYAARLRIHHGIRQNTLLTGYSVNVSTGGVFIETTSILPVETILTVEFLLPNSPNPIRCSGRVAWVNHPELLINPNMPAGMGLQFQNMSLQDIGLLRDFIKKEALLPFCQEGLDARSTCETGDGEKDDEAQTSCTR